VKQPLYISTLDLGAFQYGGVTAIALLFARTAQELGYEPIFISPSVSLHHTIKRKLQRRVAAPFNESKFQGFRWLQFGALYPEFEQFAHRFPARQLAPFLEKAPPCFAVSGNNHAALPFDSMGVPYSMWVASTYWSDHVQQVRNTPFGIRKILDYATRGPCERLESRLTRRAGIIATISNYSRDEFLKRTPDCASKFQVIKIPVDATRCFIPSPSSKRRDIVMVGRLNDPRKNVRLLLAAFRIFRKRNSDHKLLLIGSGHKDHKLISQISSHPHSDSIQCLGPVSEKEKISILQNALCLVIPSLQEGYGITGPEAMGCATPVVSTPCGGPADFVVHNETGFLMKNHSAEELADLLEKLARDPHEASRMGTSAREFCVNNLSYEAILPQLKNLIVQQGTDVSSARMDKLAVSG
jgi:glycosyltransferase involved in cell wall biosynthesis